METGIGDIDHRPVNILRHMTPYGPANMRPVFLVRGLVDTGSARIVGNDHLKLTLRSMDGQGPRYDAIAFKQAQHYEMVKRGDPFSALFVIEDNEWQGRTTVQLNIKDIKVGVDAPLEAALVDREKARSMI